jgi:NitT/TauT family transport system substrate-binding protein
MKFYPKAAYTAAVAALLGLLIGCGGGKPQPKVSEETTDLPVFSLAVSEYPSWSTFVVAKKAGLINGTEQGEPGPLEKKWGVRIKLEVKDYDPCLTMYGGGTVDAVAMTNVDALNPAMGRPSTAILPTSTSEGGDKVIGVGFTKQRGDEEPKAAAVKKFLQGQKIYGLAKSVSEYVVYRGLEKQGIDPKSVPFQNLEPAAAATALQTGSKDVKIVCVWNPYALQTLRQQKDADVLFDSGIIPEEVIDMVVVANDSLKKPGGDKFAALVCDTFYEVCKRIDNPKTADVTLKALGDEFSNLSVEDMRIVVKDTRFYSTPEAGAKLFTSPSFQSATMPTVVKTCQAIGVLDAGKAPTIGYGPTGDKQLTFDPQYMLKAGK